MSPQRPAKCAAARAVAAAGGRGCWVDAGGARLPNERGPSYANWPEPLYGEVISMFWSWLYGLVIVLAKEHVVGTAMIDVNIAEGKRTRI